MKKNYITPSIEIVCARVEKGFAGSGMRTLGLGSNEEVSSNGGIHFGNGAPAPNGSNVEGIGDGGTLYF